MYSPLFVTLMGIGTVFFGLVCIIVLTTIMGAVLKSNAKPAPAPAAAPKAAAPASCGQHRQGAGDPCSRHRGGHRGPRPQRFPYADHRHQQNLIILGEKTS